MLICGVADRSIALLIVIEVDLVTITCLAIFLLGLDDATSDKVSRHCWDLKAVVVVASM